MDWCGKTEIELGQTVDFSNASSGPPVPVPGSGPRFRSPVQVPGSGPTGRAIPLDQGIVPGRLDPMVEFSLPQWFINRTRHDELAAESYFRVFRFLLY